MYSESDIEAAVASGALTAEAAAALRASVAAGRQAPAVDEESFRLITGFNDIFVSIAAFLLLVAVGWIGSSIGGALVAAPAAAGFADRLFGTAETSAQLQRHGAAMGLVGSLAIAGASWLLAEYFTRRRRMALPSILLLAAFATGTFTAVVTLVALLGGGSPLTDQSAGIAAAGLVAAGATWGHWRRFHVPITVAAGTLALAAFGVGLVGTLVPHSSLLWLFIMLAIGLGIFAFAMAWDMSDRSRQTRRSDVAFWLHLAAAPMIAHPIFNLLGVLHGEVTAGTALIVILLYLVFGVVALAVDRRALLVSGLVYVLIALSTLFRQFGAVSLSVALTALVIGSALLMLSAFWHHARRLVVTTLPPALRDRLPELDRPAYAAPQPI